MHSTQTSIKPIFSVQGRAWGGGGGDSNSGDDDDECENYNHYGDDNKKGVKTIRHSLTRFENNPKRCENRLKAENATNTKRVRIKSNTKLS